MTSDRLIAIELDDSGLPAPTPEIEENAFALTDTRVPQGPYRLKLRVAERRLVFDVQTEAESPVSEFHLALSPFNQVIRDYFQICQSYFDAVKRLPPSQIEAIDMGRRGIHDEGARTLMERLEGKIETDKATARRLFTLICVLHFKG